MSFLHLIEIRASERAIRALERGPDLVVKPTSLLPVDGDEAMWRVGAYATDAKIAQLRTAGYEVTISMTDGEHRRLLREMTQPDG